MSISIKGIEFYDNTKDIDFYSRQGAPDLLFGLQFCNASRPLPFQYLASDSITEFKALKLNRLNETMKEVVLNSALITSNGTYHICKGDTNFDSPLEEGAAYRFVVNNRYFSTIFKAVRIDNPALLKEDAFYLLLETASKLILE